MVTLHLYTELLVEPVLGYEPRSTRIYMSIYNQVSDTSARVVNLWHDQRLSPRQNANSVPA